MNIVGISGRMCQDPELRTTTTGKSLCSFSVAVDNPFDKDNADFFRVSIWGKAGDFISQWGKKGTVVGVQGRLTSRKWTDKSGGSRETVEIVGDRIDILDWKSARDKDEQPGGGGFDPNAPVGEEESW